MRKIKGLLIITTICCLTSNCLLAQKEISILFDSTGLLISDWGEIVTSKTKINFRVQGANVHQENYLDKANYYADSLLLNDKEYIYNYFLLNGYLDSIRDIYSTKQKMISDSLDSYEKSKKAIKRERIDFKKIDSLTNIELKSLNKNVNIPKLFDTKYNQNSNILEKYEMIVIGNKGKIEDTIKITNEYKYLKFLSTKSFDTIPNKIKLRLVKTDYNKINVINRYNQFAQESVNEIKNIIIEKKDLIRIFDTLVKPYKSTIDSIKKFYPLLGMDDYNDCVDIINYPCLNIAFSRKTIEKIDCLLKLLLCKLKLNESEYEWLRNCFYLSGGKLQFNPFDFTDDSNLPMNTKADSLTFIQNKIKRISLVSTSSVLNEIEIPFANDPKSLQIRNYKLGSTPFLEENNYDRTYPNDFKIKHLVHNVPLTDTIASKVNFIEFKEENAFTRNLSPLIEGIAPLLTSLNPYSTIISGFSKLITRPIPPHTLENPFESRTFAQTVPSKTVSIGSNEIRELVNELNDLKQYIALYNTTLPPVVLVPENSTVPKYRTQQVAFETKEPPITVNYAFYSKSGKAVADTIYKSYYNIGKRTRLQFSAGLAYSFSDVWQTKAAKSATGDTLLITNDQDRLKLVLGLKFFPFGKGMFISDSKFFTNPKYGKWSERVSLFAGLSVPSPLKNIYFGAGIDVVPGLNINGGVHIFQSRNYKIVNNVIESETINYKPNSFYWGISLDPTLFTKLIDFLKK